MYPVLRILLAAEECEYLCEVVWRARGVKDAPRMLPWLPLRWRKEIQKCWVLLMMINCLKKKFNWRIITLQYCDGFCHTSAWISHGYKCVPTSWNPLPPHPIPLGCPRALALGTLLHASNLHWSSILHMGIYMFQCYSRISSHPCLFPHSSKVCSLYLCLFCCLMYRVIVTIFLNSTYIH